jgi:hypothetical protein
MKYSGYQDRFDLVSVNDRNEAAATAAASSAATTIIATIIAAGIVSTSVV